MIMKYLLASLFFFSNLYAEPFVNQQDLKFFTSIDLDCCTLLEEGDIAPYSGFLLSPYEMIYIKDAVDFSSQKLQEAIDLEIKTCSLKLETCHDSSNAFVDQLKDTLYDYEQKLDLSTQDNIKLKNKIARGKLYFAISLPLVFTLGYFINSAF